MSQATKVSVIMPCFNHGEFVQEAVESVTRSGRDDLELIVVDDGSTDERTRKEMDALSARGIKVIRQENKGLAGARNAGVLAAQGEYIFPLDADDRMRSGWLDRGIGILGRIQKSASFTVMRSASGPIKIAGARGSLRRRDCCAWNFIHASALYRRSVWEQNGGYDGTMPVQGLEDWDFWLGALEHGWKFAYLPEIFFDYRQAEGSMIKQT